MGTLEQKMSGATREDRLLAHGVSGTPSSPETWNQNRAMAQKQIQHSLLFENLGWSRKVSIFVFFNSIVLKDECLINVH
jgi:hypothetical protein